MVDTSRDCDGSLVVIHSDGDDAGSSATLADARAQGVLRMADAQNVGPRESLHAALVEARRLHPDHDVIVLAAGVRLPYAWDARLAKAVHSDPRIAAVSPLCDASLLHAIVESTHAGKADMAAIDRGVFCLSDRAVHEVPRVHSFCAYLRGDALDAVLADTPDVTNAPELLDKLCLAWAARGSVVGLADFVYVDASAVQAEAPSRAASLEERAFILHRPYSRLARALNAGLAEGLPAMSLPGLDAKPVVLHVMHYWGGGVDRWVRDFATADATRTHLLLATYRIGESGGQRVVLYADPLARVPLRTWDIAKAILATAIHSIEYRRILDEVVRDFCVDGVMVSSLIGHSLDALDLARPTLFVGHDFFPACESINPWLGRVCTRCGGEADSCAVPTGSPLPFGDLWADEWPALRRQFFAMLTAKNIAMVVPTRSAADLWQRLEPSLANHPMNVVPHGLADPGAPIPWSAPQQGEALRLVVLGRIAANKGLALLEAAAPMLAGVARLTLVGCGPGGMRLAQACGWDAIEAYAPADLREVLARIAPHAGVLASMVPETYSYTLTELQVLGIPPIATRLGAFEERIRDGQDGFLFDPNADALVSLIRSLAQDPGRLQAVASTLAGVPRPRTPRDMVDDYARIFSLAPQAVARFPLGRHASSALTDPYEQLDRAYRDLAAAYEELRIAYAAQHEAYEHTAAAYTTRDRDYTEARAQLDVALAKLEFIRTRPAAAFVSSLRRKITSGDDR